MAFSLILYIDRDILILTGSILPATMDSELGNGVIWNGTPFETLVIPAKAGIQPFGGAFPMAGGVDSLSRE
jgi:hypothetical protein